MRDWQTIVRYGVAAALSSAAVVVGLLLLLPRGAPDPPPGAGLPPAAMLPATPPPSGPHIRLKVSAITDRWGKDLRFDLHLEPAGGLGPVRVSQFGLPGTLHTMTMVTDDGDTIEARSAGIPPLVDPAGPEMDYAHLPGSGLDVTTGPFGEWRLVVHRAGKTKPSRLRRGTRIHYQLLSQASCASPSLGSYFNVPIHGSGTVVFGR